MAKGDDIRERLVTFAVLVMDLCDELSKTASGLRRGTSALETQKPDKSGSS